MEYGASAVFPCGQSQRSIRSATIPHCCVVLGGPASDTSIDFGKDEHSVCRESSECGSPPLLIGRGDDAAWEDGGSAVLQVGLFDVERGERHGRGGGVNGALDCEASVERCLQRKVSLRR